ncbi:MAG TPA: hypothetical protein VFD02_03260 [Syntrophomonadaceae bacterium]|nr:hypothetical protein [Syntrophomonadaceae bacterium]
MRKNSLPHLLYQILFIFIVLIATPIMINAASGAPVKLSGSKTTINVGETVTIFVDFSNQNYYYRFSLTNSNNDVLSFSNNTIYVENSVAGNPMKFTVKGIKPGSSTIRVKDIDSANYNTEKFAPAYGSLTINVVAKSTSKPQPPQIDNTERDKQQPTKSPEELEQEELARRMKTPLIKEIKLISNSTRLKGQLLETIEPTSEKFDYSALLGRNINNITLDIKTIKDDVKLHYDKNVSFQEGKDSLEITIKASQDKLEQNYKLKLEKPQDAKFAINDGPRKLNLMVDNYLDKSMEDLGFEKVLMDGNNPSKGFNYLMNKQRFLVGVDSEDRVFIYLDEKSGPLREVFLVSDKNNKVSILVNETLPEDDIRTFMESEYENHQITISPLLTDLDPSLEFNNKIGG